MVSNITRTALKCSTIKWGDRPQRLGVVMGCSSHGSLGFPPTRVTPIERPTASLAQIYIYKCMFSFLGLIAHLSLNSMIIDDHAFELKQYSLEMCNAINVRRDAHISEDRIRLRENPLEGARKIYLTTSRHLNGLCYNPKQAFQRAPVLSQNKRNFVLSPGIATGASGVISAASSTYT